MGDPSFSEAVFVEVFLTEPDEGLVVLMTACVARGGPSDRRSAERRTNGDTREGTGCSSGGAKYDSGRMLSHLPG